MSWDDVGRGGSGNFLKVDAGKTVRVHLLSDMTDGPFSFASVFNKELQQGVRVPEDFKQDGVKVRWQHGVVVYSFADGEVKVWIMSNTTAKKFKNVFDSYSGDLSTVDLNVSRIGTGLDTDYGVVPVPTKYAEEAAEMDQPVLDEVFAVEDDARIQEVCGGGSGGVEPVDPEAAAEPPVEEEAPPPPVARPAARPAAPKAAAVAPTNGAAAKTELLKKCIHAFATKPKYKDPKVKGALLKRVTGKVILSTCSVDELKKLLPNIR